jgi:hypothetical protein
MTVFSRDRALGVGEPRLIGRVSKSVSQTFERVGLASARRAQKVLGRFAVMLDLLDRGKAVIDLAWYFWHDRHLHWPASAIEPEIGVSNTRTKQLLRGGNVPLRGPVATSLAAVSIPGETGRPDTSTQNVNDCRPGTRTRAGPGRRSPSSPVTGPVGHVPPRVSRIGSRLALMPRTRRRGRRG